MLLGTQRVNERGHLEIGGCDVTDLARRFGTPLYVMDEAAIRDNCRRYVEAFGARYPDVKIAYASKAFLCTAMARIVDEEGLGLDVATGGELFVALNAGFPAARIVFHGNNKSDAELRSALEAGVGRIAVDSFDELDRIERLVASGCPAPRLHVRVTPGVEAHTHEFIETGTDDSKFGFSLATGDALAAVRRVVASGASHFAGIHCHIGSQVLRLDSFGRAVEKMVGLVRAIEEATGALVEELNVGGGLGVRYLPDDRPPSIAEYHRTLEDAFTKALADAGARSQPTLMVEPGRSIAATAALTLYRVGTVKTIDGVGTYVAVDGGMSDNLRPVTYGARYEAFLPARVRDERPAVVTVAGKHCEQGDLLVRDAAVPADVAVGELLAVPVTGAYGYAMASNYNKVTRPAVVFVADGRARVVVRRERPEDLVRLDLV
jgi:diaminopimelate decarboxylase